ncbi:MAG: hypothetical protein AAFY60_21960, partial [Myxococcota bacterium]
MGPDGIHSCGGARPLPRDGDLNGDGTTTPEERSLTDALRGAERDFCQSTAGMPGDNDLLETAQAYQSAIDD